jgi:hypothetical protein
MDEQSEPNGPTSRSYSIGNVGAHARVQQGEHLTWTETSLVNTEDWALVDQAFQALAQRIFGSPDLDDDTRTLSIEKVHAVADSLATADEAPERLRRSLVDARGFLSGAASWVLAGLGRILRSNEAQQVLGQITDTATQTAVESIKNFQLQ